MNEIIRQLADEAFFDENTNQPSDKMYTFTEHKMQQFAELILRECSAVANHFSDGHEVRQFDDSKRYLYFVDFGKVVLEHFGVEE